MEIADPLRASTGGVTPSSSPHNSATSSTHVPVTAGPSIQRPMMIATSCNVIVISPTGTWNVCVSGRHLSTRQVISGQSMMMWPKTSNKWYIPLRPHHHRLAAYYLSRREMAARDTHIPCPSRRDDDHVTGCCYHHWPYTA